VPTAYLKLALLLAAAMLAAGFLPPDTLIAVAAISTRPVLLAAMVVLGAALLFGGARLWGLAALALAAWGTVGLLPHYRPSPPLPEPETTVVWANVFKRHSAADRALALAEAEGAELVILGEVPLDYIAPADWFVRSERRPVLILTRQPGPVLPPTGDRRGSLAFIHEGVEIIAVHLPMPLLGLNAPAARAEELRRTKDRVGSGPTLVVGDFNTVPWSPALLDVQNQTGLRRIGIGAETTWLSPLLFVGLPIDHALASDSLEVSATVGPGLGSDHRPLVVELGRRQTTP
jgi:endonuclease/exonuclease/phosphatase (EEP) superfamily protein YafD